MTLVSIPLQPSFEGSMSFQRQLRDYVLRRHTCLLCEEGFPFGNRLRNRNTC
jgi:hypothetical protein